MSFTQIDNLELKRTVLCDLTTAEFKVYLTLCKYCYGSSKVCYPTEETIAFQTNLSERTIRRAIKSLKDKDFIAVLKNEHKNFNKNNVYIIREHGLTTSIK